MLSQHPSIAVTFYCLGTLDILNAIESQSSELDRETWRDWLWEQHICRLISSRASADAYTYLLIVAGEYGAGFRPSPFVTPEDFKVSHDSHHNQLL